MTTVPKYIAIVADCAKWSVEDAIIAATLSGKAGIERADIEALGGPLNEVENGWNTAQSVNAPQVLATQALLDDIAAVNADAVELRQIIKNVMPDSGSVLIQVGLVDPLPRKQDEALVYAVRAFTNAQELPGAQQAILTKRKWDLPRFTAALARARAAQASNDTQEKAKADAKAATEALYSQIDVLDALYRPIAKEARRVLANMPDKLDLLQLTKGVPAKPARPVPNSQRKPKPPVAG